MLESFDIVEEKGDAAALRHLRDGSSERSIRSSTIASSLARESFRLRCLGPVASAVRNGRFTSVSFELESSIFAFSAASLRRWMTILSFETSRPVSFLNSAISHSITR